MLGRAGGKVPKGKIENHGITYRRCSKPLVEFQRRRKTQYFEILTVKPTGAPRATQ
jgi:hypothetical protein